jgi:hypothetical protein
LARHLLGDAIKKEIRPEIAAIQKPFRMLFDGSKKIDERILDIETEEIKPYKKPARRR